MFHQPSPISLISVALNGAQPSYIIRGHQGAFRAVSGTTPHFSGLGRHAGALEIGPGKADSSTLASLRSQHDCSCEMSSSGRTTVVGAVGAYRTSSHRPDMVSSSKCDALAPTGPRAACGGSSTTSHANSENRSVSKFHRGPCRRRRTWSTTASNSSRVNRRTLFGPNVRAGSVSGARSNGTRCVLLDSVRLNSRSPRRRLRPVT